MWYVSTEGPDPYIAYTDNKAMLWVWIGRSWEDSRIKVTSNILGEPIHYLPANYIVG